jgi:hypothetical protein
VSAEEPISTLRRRFETNDPERVEQSGALPDRAKKSALRVTGIPKKVAMATRWQILLFLTSKCVL